MLCIHFLMVPLEYDSNFQSAVNSNRVESAVGGGRGGRRSRTAHQVGPGPTPSPGVRVLGRPCSHLWLRRVGHKFNCTQWYLQQV